MNDMNIDNESITKYMQYTTHKLNQTPPTPGADILDISDVSGGISESMSRNIKRTVLQKEKRAGCPTSRRVLRLSHRLVRSIDPPRSLTSTDSHCSTRLVRSYRFDCSIRLVRLGCSFGVDRSVCLVRTRLSEVRVCTNCADMAVVLMVPMKTEQECRCRWYEPIGERKKKRMKKRKKLYDRRWRNVASTPPCPGRKLDIYVTPRGGGRHRAPIVRSWSFDSVCRSLGTGIGLVKSTPVNPAYGRISQ